MKRIKSLSALLALTFLFCVGTVNAQVKKVDAKQQKLEYKATSNAKKNTTTQKSTNQTKEIKVVATQVGKTSAKPTQLKGTGTSGTPNTKRTNSINNLQLAPVHTAKTNPVSSMQIQMSNNSANKAVAPARMKLVKKTINRPE